MENIIKLFSEVDKEVLLWAAIFTLIALGILADMVVRICKRKK